MSQNETDIRYLIKATVSNNVLYLLCILYCMYMCLLKSREYQGFTVKSLQTERLFQIHCNRTNSGYDPLQIKL